MLLSSGVIWRHRDWDEFRRECPAGDERVQRVVWERLDGAIGGSSPRRACRLGRERRPETVGKRFEPRGLTAALAGDVELGVDGCDDQAAILCTGGFAASADLVSRYIAPAASLRLRASPWSEGDGLRHAVDRGAALTRGMDEFFGRNMPAASWDEAELVSLAQLYGRLRESSTRTGSSSSRPATSRGLRRTWSRPRRAGGAPRRTTCSTEGRSSSGYVSGRCRSWSSQHLRRLASRSRPAVRRARGHRRGGARGRLDHPHDRWAARRRAGARAAGGRHAPRGTVGGGCGRRGRVDRRLCERPGPGARARPCGRRGRRALRPVRPAQSVRANLVRFTSRPRTRSGGCRREGARRRYC